MGFWEKGVKSQIGLVDVLCGVGIRGKVGGGSRQLSQMTPGVCGVANDEWLGLTLSVPLSRKGRCRTPMRCVEGRFGRWWGRLVAISREVHGICW